MEKGEGVVDTRIAVDDATARTSFSHFEKVVMWRNVECGGVEYEKKKEKKGQKEEDVSNGRGA